jgi:[ribosomal protein S18]-alanine N-acetyltransferase
MHLGILPANIEHAQELAQLHNRLFAQPWSARSFRQLLDYPGSIAFIARAGQPPQVTGFIVGRLAADEAEILTLGVGEKWQRRGLGRKLIEALREAARQAQARRLYLEVASGNATALQLYRNMGFKQTGIRKGYYERKCATPEDAVNLAFALEVGSACSGGR